MYLLGYDIGSSSVKAALVEAASGKTVASDFFPKVEMPIIAHRAGWAEQNPTDWWENLKLAHASVMQKSGVAAADVQAIGISWQMHGLVCVDKNRKALRPAIIWCDSRAVPYGERAFNALGEEFCLSHLLNSPANFTAAKLAWVKENEPQVFEQTDKIMLPGDYIAMLLSGEVGITVEGLSEGVFWDFQKQEISAEVLRYFGFDKNIFPDIVPIFGVQARVSAQAAAELGLKEGTPIAYRAGDQPNNALSLNVFNAGEIAATAGTSGVVYGVLDKVNYDKKSRVNTFAHVNYLTPQPPLLAGEGAIRTVEMLLPPQLLANARALRQDMTAAEELLWLILRDRKLNNLKFRRQHPLKAGFILDFYCAEAKLGIEIDGGYHNKPEQQEYDAERTKVINEYGIQIIRFTNEEVLRNTNAVLDKIVLAALLPSPKWRGVGGEELGVRLGVLLCINGTGILNSWLKRNLAVEGLSYADLNTLAAQSPIGSRGISIIPFGNGAERVLENREIGCSFHNINFNTHDRSDLLRAAQEGIVFSFQYGMEIMREMEMNIRKIRAGYANMFLSPLFAQTLANVSGATIELLNTDGAAGAAKGAGMGIGYYKNNDEAFGTLECLALVEPNAAETGATQAAYQSWKLKIEN